MRERTTIRDSAGLTPGQRDAKRFLPLCRLGYRINGKDGRGFNATDPHTGEVIRRLTFEAFDTAVRKAGMTRAARSQLLAERETSHGKAKQIVASMRLQLLAMEQREVRRG